MFPYRQPRDPSIGKQIFPEKNGTLPADPFLGPETIYEPVSGHLLRTASRLSIF